MCRAGFGRGPWERQLYHKSLGLPSGTHFEQMPRGFAEKMPYVKEKLQRAKSVFHSPKRKVAKIGIRLEPVEQYPS